MSGPYHIMDSIDCPQPELDDDEAPELECDHEWEWVRDWFGDPSIPNGTCDCSGWICKLCGSTDCEDEPPGPPEPPDPRDD